MQSAATKPVALTVAFVLLPEFTLSTFAGFIDALRIASDEVDRSRQRHCRWTVLGPNRLPVRSSCGVEITPWETFGTAADFDYVVVIGGLVRGHDKIDSEVLRYLREADAREYGIVGICTGSFTLARAGLMRGHRTCVHWAHLQDFEAEFPDHRVEAESVYIVDGRRITCAGGQSAVDVAVHLIERHCGRSIALKVTSGMLIEAARGPQHPQPHSSAAWFQEIKDNLVQRAVLLMEQQSPSGPVAVSEIAAKLGISLKTLHRAFDRNLGLSPFVLQRLLRLAHSRWDVVNTRKPMAQIAWEYGFSDISHFTRLFREHYGLTPAEARSKGGILAPQANALSEGPRADVVRNQVLWGDTRSLSAIDWPSGA